MITPIRASLFLVLLTPVALSVSASSEDDTWPQWRGPNRDGISTETAWAISGKADSLWSIEVGLGYSSVTIANGRLYTKGYDAKTEMDTVWCLDPLTGKTIWSHEFPAKIWDKFHGGGTLSTPTIDGDEVYTLNREGNLHAFDAATGKVKWHKNVAEEFDVEPPTWGFAASPLVVGDELIINVGAIFSLDKLDGEVVWATENYGHAYSTPTAFDFEGEARLAVFNSRGLAVLDRKEGSELYFKEWLTNYEMNIATPIVIDDAIFISSGEERGAALVAMSDEGFEVVWESRVMRNTMSGCVLIDDHLYGFDNAMLKCIGLDGEEKWRKRGYGEGCVTGTADRVLAMTEDGELVVLAANPDEYTELSKAKVIDSDSGVFWTMPVLVDGLIFCRASTGELVCRDHRQEG